MAQKASDKLANFAIISGLLDTYLDYNQRERQMYMTAASRSKNRQIVKGADGFQYYADTKERVIPEATAPADTKDAKYFHWKDPSNKVMTGTETQALASGQNFWKQATTDPTKIDKEAKDRTYKGADGHTYWLEGDKANQRVNKDIAMKSSAKDRTYKGADGYTYWLEGSKANERVNEAIPMKASSDQSKPRIISGPDDKKYYEDIAPDGTKTLTQVPLPKVDYKAQTLDYLNNLQNVDVSGIIKHVEADTSVTKADLSQYTDQAETKVKDVKEKKQRKINIAKSQVSKYAAMKSGEKFFTSFQSDDVDFQTGVESEWKNKNIVDMMHNIRKYNIQADDQYYSPEEFAVLNKEFVQYKINDTAKTKFIQLNKNDKTNGLDMSKTYKLETGKDKTGKEIKKMDPMELLDWFGTWTQKDDEEYPIIAKKWVTAYNNTANMDWEKYGNDNLKASGY
jgi:hypothetical protein